MPPPLLWSLLLVLLVIGISVLFYPRRSQVSGNWLSVQTFGPTLRFDLREAESIEPVDRADFIQFGTLRVCGVGWPLRSYGWFWKRGVGLFLAMPTNYDHLLFIRFPKRLLLVSPENGHDLLVASARQ